MGLIKISELRPNMMLAEDLRNYDGRFLFPKEAILTPRHIKVLKIWGIVEVDIKGVEPDQLAGKHNDYDPVIVKKAEQIINARLVHVDTGHSAMEELRNLCILRKAEELRKTGMKTSPGAKSFSGTNRGKDDGLPGEDESLFPVDIDGLLQNDIYLPTLPTIFNKINETIMNPNSSANDIGEVISKDTGLSARLLQIVNSAFYGFPSKIDTLSRAVAVIGTKQLTMLACGISIIKMFEHIPSDCIDMELFWKHSLTCGLTARAIAGYKNIQNTERLFVSGLLHDIGRLILYSYWPKHALKALKKARRESLLLFEVERQEIGIDHAAIGGLLAKKWKLPFLLENTIHYHHEPTKSQNRLEAAIVHLADIITNATGIGSTGEVFVPPLNGDSWKTIGLSNNVLSVTVEYVDRQLDEIKEFFFSH